MLIAALLIQNFSAIQERTFPHSPKIPLQQTIIISYHHKYITGMTESVKLTTCYYFHIPRSVVTCDFWCTSWYSPICQNPYHSQVMRVKVPAPEK